METLSTTKGLKAGDVLTENGNRVVASTERNMNNLGATLINFTDGSYFHAGTFDIHPVTRA